MSIAAFVALSIFLLLAVGRPMLRFIQDPGGFRAWVDGHGVWGRIAFVGMMFFQVVVAIIPRVWRISVAVRRTGGRTAAGRRPGRKSELRHGGGHGRRKHLCGHAGGKL